VIEQAANRSGMLGRLPASSDIDGYGNQEVRAGKLAGGSQSHSATAAAVSIFVDGKLPVVHAQAAPPGPYLHRHWSLEGMTRQAPHTQ